MIKVFETVFGKKEVDMVENPELSEMPKTLYKYRDWGNLYHKKVLTKSQVFFASPESFNDPFDCGIEIGFHHMQEDIPMREEYFERLVTHYTPHLQGDDKVNEIKRHIEAGKFKDDDYLDSMHRDLRKKFNNQFGILSLTPINDNILMWSHYANSHKGFCVGFDSEKLFESVGGSLGDVTYFDEYPDISPLEVWYEQHYKQSRSKAHFWNYEIEYRHIKQLDNGRIYTLIPETIKEVILGAAIIDTHKKKILEITRRQHPKAKVFQTFPKKRAFEMSTEQIV